MQIQPTSVPGLVAIEPDRHADERGFFVETYRRSWHEQVGIPPAEVFVQDNHSRSERGVLRGLHLQLGEGVAKLVRCVRGRIFDVGVDLRRGSPTYGQWAAVELDDENLRELYLPVGFAHGFCVLSEVADVVYKQSAYYDPGLERAIAWDDPEIAVSWPLPVGELVVSERDRAAPRLAEVAEELPFSWHP
jgi:dTDP-4-dehydrorhamnose 3,5-epimerase